MGRFTREEPNVESSGIDLGVIGGDRSRETKNEETGNLSAEKILRRSEPLFRFKEVRSPSHYASSSIECIDAIRSQLSPEEFRGYLRGSIAKYNWRLTSKHKDPNIDAEKIVFYAMMLAGKDPRKE